MKKNKTMKPFVKFLKTMRSAGFGEIVLVILLSALFSKGAFAFSIGAANGLNCGTTPTPECKGEITSALSTGQYEEVHQMITSDALLQSDVAYTPSSSVASIRRFWFKQIKEIQDANRRVDYNQSNHALHFDNESFSYGEEELKVLQSKILAKLQQPAIMSKATAANTRKLFGAYLHTLQDFFAHSSWVNDPTNNIGDVPKFWEAPQSLHPTTAKPCPSNIPLIATSSLDASDPLTSGYAGSFSDLATANAPLGKCAHGLVGNGIHKDWNGREFHPEARAQAIYATAEAAKYILNFPDNKPDNVCMFMTDSPCGTKLTTTVTGKGSVTYSLPTISGRRWCDSATSPCTEYFDISNDPNGSSVTLTATENGGGYIFTGWSGPDAGSCPAPASGGSTGTCAITMDGKEKNITATFGNNVSPPPDIVGTWNAQYYNGKSLPYTYCDQWGCATVTAYSVTLTADGHFYDTKVISGSTDGGTDSGTIAYKYTYNPLTPTSQTIKLVYLPDPTYSGFYDLKLSWVTDHWEMDWSYGIGGWKMIHG